jgi:hypothetical protein
MKISFDPTGNAKKTMKKIDFFEDGSQTNYLDYWVH